MAAPSLKNPSKKSKDAGMSAQKFRGLDDHHIAIVNSPQVLASNKLQKSGCSKSSSNKKSSCKCSKTGTICGTITIFNDTWEIIGSCARTWQTVTKVQTSVDIITCEHTTVDTITNKPVHWSILTNTKQAQKKLNKFILIFTFLDQLKNHSTH